MNMKRILLDDGLDLVAAVADADDDSTISWNLPAGDEEVTGGVVLVEELDVGRHVRIDFRERGGVFQFDDEHGHLAAAMGPLQDT